MTARERLLDELRPSAFALSYRVLGSRLAVLVMALDHACPCSSAGSGGGQCPNGLDCRMPSVSGDTVKARSRAGSPLTRGQGR